MRLLRLWLSVLATSQAVLYVHDRLHSGRPGPDAGTIADALERSMANYRASLGIPPSDHDTPVR